jgi:hypothetical protein
MPMREGNARRELRALEVTAYHEAGHVVVHWALGESAARVSLRADDDSFGHAVFSPRVHVRAEPTRLAVAGKGRCRNSLDEVPVLGVAGAASLF